MSWTDTITIYCCGTCFHEGKLDETVAYTYSKTEGKKWINQGPGHESTKKEHRIPKTEELLEKIETQSWVKKMKKMKITGKDPGKNMIPDFDDPTQTPKAFRHPEARGNKDAQKGYGTQDNIVTTLQWLWYTYYETQPVKSGRAPQPKFDRINLVGWSRGAVTCIMLAHAIKAAGFTKVIPTLKINIFTFDPVPGAQNDFGTNTDLDKFDKTGRFGSKVDLSSIVNQYSSILMEHITGKLKGIISKDWAFKCISPRFKPEEGSGGNATFYPLPGEHADCVMYKTNPAGKIGLHLCHQFLKDNGTDLKTYEMMSNTQLLENYSELRMKYATGAQHAKTEPTKHRKKLVVNTKRSDSYFVNLHHYETFRKTLPMVLDDIESGKKFGANLLKVIYPKTMGALNQLGYI
ncbi:MAG: hypothetical protein ABIK28_22195 [Planctomycetota bacterium]